MANPLVRLFQHPRLGGTDIIFVTGAATGQTAKRLMRACRNAISPKDAPAPSRTSQAKPSPSTRPNLNGGSWGDHLHWRKGRPQDLTMRGMWEKRRVFQLEWLDDQAFRFFSARRCYALAGSTRLRTAPIAGSLLWSLLLRGMYFFAFRQPVLT